MITCWLSPKEELYALSNLSSLLADSKAWQYLVIQLRSSAVMLGSASLLAGSVGYSDFRFSSTTSFYVWNWVELADTKPLTTSLVKFITQFALFLLQNDDFCVLELFWGLQLWLTASLLFMTGYNCNIFNWDLSSLTEMFVVKNFLIWNCLFFLLP